jgi:signal transduction histidine kinase
LSAVTDDRDEQALGQLIAARCTEIEERWFDAVCAELETLPDVQPTQLRDGMPDYLADLARLLAGRELDDNGAESWVRIAREHGITRVKAGFDIEQLAREFTILRKVIEKIALDAWVLTGRSAITLADLIEAAIRKSVSAYVERRDYEARCRQAENIAFLIHELRNPLTSAVAAADLLRHDNVAAQQEVIAALERAHARFEKLIDSVLLTEQLEAGKIEPAYGEVRACDLVVAATAAAQRSAAAKRIAFDVHCSPELVVSIDSELTRSALQNLVDNAVKYTDSGRVDVTVEEDDATWTVHVRDTGPGLSDAELRTIFEPFTRGSTTKKGTGLGLAIGRRAIELQGGMMAAESPGESGSHFWFALPKRRS